MNSAPSPTGLPWKKSTVESNNTMKSPVQISNGRSTGAMFSIRSSVMHEDLQKRENDVQNEDSERINFSAVFNMFEANTLPVGNNKRRQNYYRKNPMSGPKEGSCKIASNKDGSENSLKLPNSDSIGDSHYITPPNRLKQSTTKIVLSPPTSSSKPTIALHVLSSNGKIHNKSETNNTVPGDSNSDATMTLSRTVFRSHCSAIIPSPPPQASYTPAQNIQWPLINKTGYIPNIQLKGSSNGNLAELPGSNTQSQNVLKSPQNGFFTGVASSVTQQKQESEGQGPLNGSPKSSFTVALPEVTGTKDTTVSVSHKLLSTVNRSPLNQPKITSLESQSLLHSSKHEQNVDPHKSTAVVQLSSKPPSSPILTNQKDVQKLTNGHAEKQISEEVTSPEVTQEVTVVTSNVKIVTSEVKFASPEVKVMVSDILNGHRVTLGTEHQDISSDDDEKVKEKVTLKNWDPTPVLDDLYTVKLLPDIEDATNYVNMEGYMEKLPTNKKKATLLKTWKRRYFKTKDGKLYYFESNASADKASAYFQLMGGSIEELGGHMIGVDDGRGRYLVVRCPTEKEFHDWLMSLRSHTGGNITSTYIKPALSVQPHRTKKIIVVDIGSCSVRAGILGEKAALPSVFFPTIMAKDKKTGKISFGKDCYKPDIRTNAHVSFPVQPSSRVDKSVDLAALSGMFRYIYNQLGVNPKHYWVMLSAPSNLSDKMKEQFMDILIREYDAPGVNIVNQSLLALYSYNAKTGIIVDIGDRLEIVPVTDGYVAEAGITRHLYGGRRVGDAMKSALTENKYHFLTDLEYLLVRLVMEKLCFVSKNYQEDLNECSRDSKYYSDGISLDRYGLPEGYPHEVNVDQGRFKTSEGLFNTEVWGIDNPPLHKLILKAIQASPLDTRREMWRSIYLSGGATMIPGFADRLEADLNKIAPSSIVVQVHASPQRYHSAYIGASTLASLPQFEQVCITNEEWLKQGRKILKKWHMC